MNPSQEEPTKEELLDGELSEEELYTIAAGTAVGAKVKAILSGLTSLVESSSVVFDPCGS
ncbi:hypothetical protein [Dendronalium sp. ChiSLP03b]|uniref:hypothetical protein n=1 Tax=Dendronalium sp. ChiSLP03b TaxID=3075381 RepID=UPI002AD6EA41|nr:hypothetical protein [Dendronalium sp. ChiSLP03b]